jgi:hypothetical protein
MLTENIAKYIHDLKSSFPSITSVWLIGSRGNGTAREDSDWDFIIFSSLSLYDGVKNAPAFHREDVDLLLVGDDGKFSKPFGNPKMGSLKEWKWSQVSDTLSHYEECKWVPDEEAAAEGMENLGNLDCKIMNAHLV